MVRLINCDTYDYVHFKRNQFIEINDEGEIIEVDDMSKIEKDKNHPSESMEIIDLKGKLVIPGFVLSHTHIYSTFARGVKLKFHPRSFKDILEQLWWKLDSKLTLEDIYYSALVSGIEFVRNGIITVFDHHASGEIRNSLKTLKSALVDEIGLRGIFCFETSDRFDVDETIEENLEFLKNKSKESAGLFGLHASLSLSDETLKKVASVLNGYPIHIHVAESIEDEKDSIEKSGKRVVERLEEFNLLNDNSILAHCVHLDENELDILMNKKVYVAFNITSNMNNGVGIPDYSKFKERGIKVVVGNDGLGYGITRDYMNLFFSQRCLKKDPNAFGFDDLINVIKNSYELVENILGIKIGRIEKGYKADLVTFEYKEFTEMDEENVFAHLFFGIFDSPDVSDTIINGRFLMKDKELIFDEKEILIEAFKVSKKLWNRLTSNRMEG